MSACEAKTRAKIDGKAEKTRTYTKQKKKQWKTNTNSSVHFFLAMRCVDDDSVAQEKEAERWQEANRKTYGVLKIDRYREKGRERKRVKGMRD